MRDASGSGRRLLICAHDEELDLERSRGGYVHSVFARAANFVTDDGALVTLLEEGAPGFPHALYLEGSPGAIGVTQGERWSCNGCVITLSSAGCALDGRNAAPRRLRRLSLPRGKPVTVSAEYLLPSEEGRLLRVLCENMAVPAGALAKALKALVGRGEGLTPLGDDMLAGLAGVLAALEPRPLLYGEFRRELEELLPRTTLISTAYLTFALDGRLSEPAVVFARALLNGGEREISESFDALCAWGHTSGRGIAAGIGEGLLIAARLS